MTGMIALMLRDAVIGRNETFLMFLNDRIGIVCDMLRRAWSSSPTSHDFGFRRMRLMILSNGLGLSGARIDAIACALDS